MKYYQLIIFIFSSFSLNCYWLVIMKRINNCFKLSLSFLIHYFIFLKNCTNARVRFLNQYEVIASTFQYFFLLNKEMLELLRTMSDRCSKFQFLSFNIDIGKTRVGFVMCMHCFKSEADQGILKGKWMRS